MTRTTRSLLAHIAAGVGLWLGLAAGWLQPIEQRLYDMRARFAAAATTPDTRIVVVAIDDESLQQMQHVWGRWPWPREAMAHAVEQLQQAHTIALDVLFAETDQNHARGDVALTNAIAAHGRVVGATYPSVTEGLLLSPFPALESALAAIGHVRFQADRDGVVRRHLPTFHTPEESISSLASAAARQFDAAATRHDEEFLIRWARQPHETIPIHRLLTSPAPSTDSFRNKFVWIGSTATGVEADRQTTSLGTYVPGVQTLAMASDNLLNNRFYRTLPTWLYFALLIGLAFLGSSFAGCGPSKALLAVVGCIAAYAATAWWSAWLGWMLPVVLPIGMLLLGGSLTAYESWRRERVVRIELEELELARQSFTDMLVHDMNNQIQPLTMSIQLLRNDIPNNPADSEITTRLARAASAAEQLENQLQHLLSLRRIQENVLPSYPSEQPLAEAMKTVLEDIADVASRRHISWNARVEDQVSVWFDPALLYRVLYNLVWNAIQHAPPRSTVCFDVLVDEAGHVTLHIANAGQVVPPDQLNRVFEPFVTGASREDRKGGSGLGLALCRLAVEMHGGTIAMQSPRPGESDGVRVDLRFGTSLVEA